ncbi:MAG TPA: hypothetical protein VKV96_02395 [Roseiarcus sp.]|nr:hypothetical protein [Roseiarcus sp.]
MDERRFTPEGGPYELIYFGERVGEPTEWTVEAYHRDGAVEQAIFIGPDARERAVSYLRQQYGFDAAT